MATLSETPFRQTVTSVDPPCQVDRGKWGAQTGNWGRSRLVRASILEISPLVLKKRWLLCMQNNY